MLMLPDKRVIQTVITVPAIISVLTYLLRKQLFYD
jgi:hypothetical protein